MSVNQNDVISDERKEVLQEVMNIAFGKATADLAEVIDIYVALSVPHITVLPTARLSGYIKDEIKDYDSIDIVNQHFWGKFKGIAYLIFSSGSGKKLVTLLQDSKAQPFNSESMDSLEKETLVEVGNILIGACIGKLAELLGDIVTYSPPHVIIEGSRCNAISDNLFEPDSMAIVLKTVFHFERQEVGGLLFLITSHESINWLENALDKFMGQYE